LPVPNDPGLATVASRLLYVQDARPIVDTAVDRFALTGGERISAPGKEDAGSRDEKKLRDTGEMSHSVSFLRSVATAGVVRWAQRGHFRY
jgi:hypothetical protein